jgi:hypothetical protein
VGGGSKKIGNGNAVEKDCGTERGKTAIKVLTGWNSEMIERGAFPLMRGKAEMGSELFQKEMGGGPDDES